MPLSAAIRFCLASLCVYATVAFAEGWLYATIGKAGAYILWTTLFILLGSVALYPSARGISRPRFTVIFASAFLAYAVFWTFAYFTLRGSTGEWVGSFAGCLLMAFVFALGFNRVSSTPTLFVYLFAANSAGYFLGSILNSTLGGRPGMLMWGVGHGLLFGAGVGKVLGEIDDVEREDVEI